MKKIFLLGLGLTLTFPLFARKLYIEPGGEVNAIKKAIENLEAGDTLLVKSGTYELDDMINVRHSGNRHHRICVFGYDDEPDKRPAVNPVFDFSKQPHTGDEWHGDRCWSNSDDGWDLYYAVYPCLIDNCWAIYNGYLEDGSIGVNGNGFKQGGNKQSGGSVGTVSVLQPRYTACRPLCG